MRKEEIVSRLRDQGIQPSAQRVAIAQYILTTDTHPTADEVWKRVRKTFPFVSRATVYNTLKTFVEKRLLRNHIVGDATVFDPNLEQHHHFMDEETGIIQDIHWDVLKVSGLETLEDYDISEYLVVLRGTKKSNQKRFNTHTRKESTMSTIDNLKAAFAGESQANRKYLAFAQKAESDGFPQVAKLFRAAAEAETVHAHAHLRALDGIKGTAENLKAAIGGEGYEFKEMYPVFLEESQKEGNKKAEISFKNALAVEETHHGLYSEALQAVEGGKDLPNQAIYVCNICGHTHYAEAPDRCPACNAPKERFFEVK